MIALVGRSGDMGNPLKEKAYSCFKEYSEVTDNFAGADAHHQCSPFQGNTYMNLSMPLAYASSSTPQKHQHMHQQLSIMHASETSTSPLAHACKHAYQMSMPSLLHKQAASDGL